MVEFDNHNDEMSRYASTEYVFDLIVDGLVHGKFNEDQYKKLLIAML